MATNKDQLKDQLKDKVVTLVKEFVKMEGGITQKDLQLLFQGFLTMPGEVATALAESSILFTD